MADKEVTIYIVDVAKSMGRKRRGRDQTDLDWALRYVWDKITATVYTGRKTATLGVLGLGTDETNNDLGDDNSYSHISLLQPVSQILMPELRNLEEALRPSHTDERDAISAIILAIQLIEGHCKHLKYNKKIVLVSNGTGTMDPDNIEEIAAKLKKEGIELVILGVDFDDAEYGFKEDDKSPVKAKNEKLLRELSEKSDGVYGTMQEAIQELFMPRLKLIRPMATYKGELRLGDRNSDTSLTIQIERYHKVLRKTVPSASSIVIKPEGATQDDEGVLNVRSSYVYKVNDPDGAGGIRHIGRDELAKGYEYGRTAVHISESEENITKFETDASYEILGFIPIDRVERYTLLDASSVVVAQKASIKASLALSSLCHALFELESCIIARFVRKDMANPVITLLSPSIQSDFECLLENQLPFAEDVRSYCFPPLDKIVTVSGKSLSQHRNLPNNDLLNSMSDFVDSMDLSQTEEEVVMDEVFSPIIHRVEDAIKYKAVHPKDSIPPIAETLVKHSHPSKDLLLAGQKALQRLTRAADIKKVPPKVKGRKRYRDAEKPISGLNVEELFRKEKKSTISPDNAIPEFKRMLASSEDLESIKAAVKQMAQIIEDQIKNSFGNLAYGRALEGISVMRQEMLDLEEPAIYNDVLRDLKKRILAEQLGGNRREMWWMIRTNRYGLIDKISSHVSDVTEEQAKDFMLV